MSIKTIKHFTFDQGKKLGEGSTGTVYLGTDLRSHTPVAVKAIELKNIDNQVTQYLLKNEVQALKITNHPNVLKAIDVIQDTQFCYVVTDYLPNGTLAEYIDKKGSIEQEEALLIFKQLVDGYEHIFDLKIHHRDLKPHNILFDAQFKPILSDFGYCQIAGFLPKPSLSYNVGSPGYMAPQSIVGNLYSQNSEVWSLGTILYEMMTGKNYTNGKPVMQAVMLIKRQGPYYPETSSDFVKLLLKQSMMLKPEQRMKVKALKQQLHDHFSKTASPVNLPSQTNNYIQHNVQTLQLSNQIKSNAHKNNLISQNSLGFIQSHPNQINQIKDQKTLNRNSLPDNLAINNGRLNQVSQSPNIIRNIAPNKRIPIFNTPLVNQLELTPDHLKTPQQQSNTLKKSMGSLRSSMQLQSAPFFMPNNTQSIDDMYMLRNPFNVGQNTQITPSIQQLKKSGNFMNQQINNIKSVSLGQVLVKNNSPQQTQPQLIQSPSQPHTHLQHQQYQQHQHQINQQQQQLQHLQNPQLTQQKINMNQGIVGNNKMQIINKNVQLGVPQFSSMIQPLNNHNIPNQPKNNNNPIQSTLPTMKVNNNGLLLKPQNNPNVNPHLNSNNVRNINTNLNRQSFPSQFQNSPYFIK